MTFVLKEFEAAAIGAWQAGNTRPEQANTVWRIRPVGANDTFEKRYSYWDGTNWGRAFREGDEVLSATEGGYTVNQDREWAGLAAKPEVRTPIEGRVAILKQSDPAMIGMIVDLQTKDADGMFYGSFNAAWGTSLVTIHEDNCSPVFRTDGPLPEAIQAMIDDAVTDKVAESHEVAQTEEEDNDPL